jgi:hypothetical protein
VSGLAHHRASGRLLAIALLVLAAALPARAQPQEGEPEPPQQGQPESPPASAPPPELEDPEAGFGAPAGEEEPTPPAAEPTVPAQTSEPTPDAQGEPRPDAQAPPEGEATPAAGPPAEEEHAVVFAPAPEEEAAQEAEQPPTEEPCDPTKETCACPKNWGCWELLYTTKGTILGAKATITYSDANGAEGFDAGFITFYSTEHYATRDNLTVHVLAFGGIGGGTAHNEGSLGFGLDFGWRGSITETSGPFLRVGMGGMMTGHRAFYLSLFEPFQGRAGYQLLDGDTVLEAGITHGIIPVGRFDPGEHARRDLSRTKELGAYLALHREDYRADATFMHVFDPEAGKDRDDVEIVRAMYCDYRLGFALCADGLFTRGEARKAGRERMTNALYFGITLGLTP